MSMFVDHKEVVRIQVKKIDGWLQPEVKNLCVDPQITSYEMLQNLLARAFDIRSDFTISYLATDDAGEEVYLSLLSDWDLDAAFFGASNPLLRLKVDVRPFEEAADDWELIGQMSTKRALPSGGAGALLTTSNLIMDGLSKTVSNVTKAIGMRIDDAATQFRESPSPSPVPTLPARPPLSDVEFHTYLDAVGRLVQPQQFRLAVYQGGVEYSLRPVVWRHLLNIYPGDMSGRERFDYVRRKSNEYYRLRDEWLSRESTDTNVQTVVGMVRKDVHRTDRLHTFYSGENNPNGTALFNLLVTFALTHPQLSYWQGMSDIASPILVVQTDEAVAYVCFCALMRRLARCFASDGSVMATRFRQLAMLVRHFDAEFYWHICRCSADDMFFTYRWLLLEMKREFPLDDAMYALEVMWSSLPLDPPEDDLLLCDAAYLKSGTFVVSPVSSQTEAYVQLRSTQRRMSGGGKGSSVSTLQDVHAQQSNATLSRQSNRPGSRLSTDKGATVISEHVESIVDDETSKVAKSVEKSVTPRPGHVVRETPGLHRSPDRSDGVHSNGTTPGHLVESGRSSRLPSSTGSTDEGESDEQTKLLESSTGIEDRVRFAEVSSPAPLPSPLELGCGNPFLMFVCLSTLLLQRNQVMTSCVDYNDIAMHYDKMVRQHRVQLVMQHARQLYATYLKQQQLYN